MEMYFVLAGVLLPLLLNARCTSARPQELETSVLLAVAQMKQLAETGAAAQNEHSFEVLGQRMGAKTTFGFGDAVQRAAGRRRRQTSDVSELVGQ